MIRSSMFLTAAAGLALTAGVAIAQPAPATRIRGTIEKVDGSTITVKPRSGADVVVKLTDNVSVTGVARAQLADVKPGSYIGSAAATQPDGTLKALEVTVFPPAMAGAGEGHFPWDMGSNSTMTNGTVGDLVTTSGRTMTVKYKGEEKKIVIPDDVPIVVLHPGAPKSLIAVGAKVIVQPTKAADGTMTAARINVGEDGITPPM